MSDQPFDPRGPKAARNERRKLLATTANTIGLTVFALGFLTPVFRREALSWMTVALCIAILFVMHLLARRFVRDLED